MTVLTPRNPLRFTKARLDQAFTNASPLTDTDILAAINEGYQRAVERAYALERRVTIATVAGTQEYVLPSDLYRIAAVYQNGSRLERQLGRFSLDALQPGYYQRQNLIGLPVEPVLDGSLILRYHATPAELGWDDTPDPCFGPEWYYLLWHYAASKIMLAAGDAGAINYSLNQRGIFDDGVSRLKRQARQVDGTRAPRMRSANEVAPSAR